MVSGNKQKLSFSAGSLLFEESLITAELFNKHGDWNKVFDIILNENLFKKETNRTKQRYFTEIRKRLKLLTETQINSLIDLCYEDQRKLLFLSVCKCYKILTQFVVEVLRKKVLTFDNILTELDYDIFIEIKETECEELEGISDISKKKNKQVIFRLLSEAGLIESVKTKIITPSLLSKDIMELVVKDDPNWLKVFLLSDFDILKAKEAYADG